MRPLISQSDVVRQQTPHQTPSFESLERRTLFAALPTDLDLSFSSDGKVITDFGGANDVARAVAIQTDGKIVVAGETQVTVNGVKKTAFAAVRYNKDGTLDDGSATDTTKGDKFAANGKFTRVLDQGGGTGALALVIQKDGKIILGGNAIKSAALGSQWYILRLNKDGTPDTGYGVSGVQSTNIAATLKSSFRAMTLTPEGKLLIAGGVEGDWAVSRLTTDGKFDKFAGISADFGGNDYATAITCDNVGNILVAGNGGASDFALARFTPAGQPDNSFGTLGRTVYKTSAFFIDVSTITFQPHGEIHVGVGLKYKRNNGQTITAGIAQHFTNKGASTGNLEGFGWTSLNGIGTLPGDSQITAGGTSKRSGFEKFYVYGTADGSYREVTFGANTDANVASAFAIAPDGKIVQVGYTTAGGGTKNFAIVRYVGKPTKDFGQITGVVFNDTDQDSVKDTNEAGSGNVRVYIDDNNNGVWDEGDERSFLTDSNGNYKFVVKPGSYRIREVFLPPLAQTLPRDPTGSYLVNITAGKTVGGIDFGNVVYNRPAPKTQIVGSVFFDFDGDGFRDIQKPTEPDLADRVVFLDHNANDVIDPGEPQTKTDAAGNYKFTDLVPGNYRIRDILPAGWTNTDPSSGSFDVMLLPNQTIERHFATTFADDDDTISEVNNRQGNQISVGGSVNFTIGNVTDADLVRFTVKKGQKVGFDVDRAAGSGVNSFLRLFDANGNQLATNDDAAAPGETKGADSYLEYTFNTAGTYYIAVSNNQNRTYEPRFGYDDNGIGSTGAYKLSLVNISPAPAAAFSQVRVSSMFTKRDERISADDVTRLLLK
jgi:uncharacterized delta-60 repeat protein